MYSALLGRRPSLALNPPSPSFSTSSGYAARPRVAPPPRCTQHRVAPPCRPCPHLAPSPPTPLQVAQLLSALACARHFLSGRGADGAATLALSRAAVAAVLAKGAAAGALGWPALAAATWDLGGAALVMAWAYVF